MQNRIFYGRYLRCIVLLLCVTLLGSVLTSPTFAYIVTKTSSIINTFISGLAPEGGIVIRKTLEHPFEDTYVIPDHVGFGFRVELGEAYAGKTIITTQGDQVADSYGNIIVTIKPGESVGIREITAGTAVTVTELAQSPGFAVKDGIVTQMVTVAPRKDATIRFVNTYTPAPVPNVNLEVTGIKNLEGRPWQEGDAFTFQLEHRYLGDETSQWTQLGTASVAYDPAVNGFNCFDLTELVQSVQYDRTGTYSFRVSEIAGVIGGITYDELVSYFDVQVSDVNMDGYLEFSHVTGTAGAEAYWDDARSTYCVRMAFSNQYAPAGSAAVSIPIRKTVEDRSGQIQTADGYTFELYTLEGQLLQTSEPTSASGETGLRLVYEAEQAGQTFTYVVKETGCGTIQGAMAYDATEYVINVTVTDNLDGTIRAAADVQELCFVNTYDPQDAATYFEGTKTLEGRDLREGEFIFQLYQADANFETAQDALPTFTAVNQADGNFAFGPVIYDQVGTYYYLIREDASAPIRGIVYDETVYRLTVTVRDENGVLTTEAAITDVAGQPAELRYQNTYSPISAFLQMCGKKVLQGATLKDGQFHFKLFEADGNFEPIGQAVQTVTNTAAGTFSFDPILYDQTGTYRYVIREEIVKRVEGVIYDDTVYGVTVNVTDDGSGALVAQTEIVQIGGNAAEEIVFENVYMPQGPDTPTDPEQPDDPDPPKTDHPLNLTPYVVMVALSLVLLIMLLLWDKYGWRYR